MDKLCENCSHFKENVVFCNRNCVVCELTNTIMVNESAQSCNLYNKDMSEEDICFNCKHFIGGGDWGLACAKHYHRLPRALDKMCEDGEFNT